jgi:hypothetical protein
MRDEPGRAVHRGPMAAWTEGTGARRRAHRSMASGHSGARKLTSQGPNMSVLADLASHNVNKSWIHHKILTKHCTRNY